MLVDRHQRSAGGRVLFVEPKVGQPPTYARSRRTETGSTISIAMNEPHGDGSATWQLDVAVVLLDGERALGRVLVPAAATVGQRSRVVALAFCPGVKEWIVAVRCTSASAGAGGADVTVRREKCCASFPGVTPIAPFATPGSDNEIARPNYEDATNGVAATVNKPVAIADYAPSRVTSFAAVSASTKASPGMIYGAVARNRNAGVRFFQVFDKAAIPVGGDVPILSVGMASATQLALGPDFFTRFGTFLASGLAWGYSSTEGTYTAGTAAEHDAVIFYR